MPAMLAHRLLLGLLVLASPTLARAQAATTDEDAVIEEDRVLSGRMLELSGHDPGVFALRRELHDLDYRLRGHTRPPDLFDAGLGLVIPGAAGVVAGVALFVGGAIQRAVHGAVCGIGTALGTSCSGSPSDALFLAGGVSLGVGLLVAVVGLVVAFSGHTDRTAFERRDALREDVRTWLGMVPATDGTGAVLVVGGGY